MNRNYNRLLCRILSLMMLMTLTIPLSACGKNQEIEVYKANMTQFFENIQTIDSAINQLDPESETVSADLLSLLDSLDKSFQQMASREVPDGFPGVAELSQDASKYMSEAVSYYHQAYDSGEYDKTSADIAYQNYEIANKRFQYIVQILHGDIPEEIFTYEDDSEDVSEDTSAENADMEDAVTEDALNE